MDHVVATMTEVQEPFSLTLSFSSGLTLTVTLLGDHKNTFDFAEQPTTFHVY